VEQHPKPIFYDERGRRWPALLRLWAILGLILSLLGIAFTMSVVTAPLLPGFRRPAIPFMPDPSRPLLADNHAKEERAFALSRTKRELNRLRARKLILPRRARAADHQPLSIVTAFYVNWNPASFASLEKHADALTHLIPEWIHLGAGGSSIQTEEDPKVIEFAATHKLPILPLLNNVANENWQPARLHKLLSSPPAQDKVIGQLLTFLRKYKFRGLNVDLESSLPEDRAAMTRFIQRLSVALHKGKFTLSQDVATDDDGYDLAALGKANDFLIPMLYDEHDSSGMAGPIASQSWYEEQAAHVYDLVPPEKIVLGVGSYAYDWQRGKPGAASVDYEEAMLDDRESADVVKMDPDSLNPHVSYDDERGDYHDVWFLDATTVYNELLSQRENRPLGAALWVLGSEDPSLWTFFHRSLLARTTNPQTLQTISFAEEAEFKGKGELLDIASTPSSGEREIKTDANGYIVGQNYLEYPSPFVIQQYGDQKKSVALTFDDGPDPTWTPQVLDVLHHFGVPATFFVMGSNAEKYPNLIRREYSEGHEIGNHTYYHPDLSQASPLRVKLELTATQRAIETLTGHSTHLFRPPYTVDTTPQTATQIEPLVLAKQMGYITVGSNIDPNDWATPGVQQILYGGKPGPTLAANAQDVDTIDGVFPTVDKANQPGEESYHILLLHDAGGDRSQTLAALPHIIEGLRKRGYVFTTISGLMGNRSRDAMMPKISSHEAVLIGADRVWFEMVYQSMRWLQFAFFLALILGISRIAFTAALALIQARRARTETFDPGFQPPVTVVIAAFNEAKVIRRTIETLLDSDYADLDVLVVDDGSTDGTDDVVREAFGDEPRVSMLEKENGGKASALNLGIAQARGEILVGLDADTLFAKDTVSLLVRRFKNPKVAAVAGSVKVGNRINLWTIWQSLEYVISQNFDRRAYSALNCITVVPGAVGAWRKWVVQEAGGYLGDTLAEDTDLTLRVRRMGYKIETENAALAYTEAPDTLETLARQRFRWAFGTLQCLWKHRDALFNPKFGALGFVALPTLWLFQIGFQAMSPVVDLAILWAALRGNLAMVGYYYGLFMLIELVGAWIAVKLDKEDPRLLLWMFWQRFAYRQLMYYVLARSVFAAIRGGKVGWGKLERKGTAVATLR
jgi:cellulose synthase/poly-beta-1,6-N-acetylglucosamine synthase-like glycosyltransferase/peptidoglycan/xylan/chitin deacetylase (PgdA/CDA1 family)/spore germination protein YaaH